jgi:hypothetical protein
LCARRGPGERGDPGRDGAEDEWIGERLGEDPAGIDQVGQRERERGDAKAEPLREIESPSQPVDRQRRERHGERAEPLDEVVGGADVVHEPGRRGHDRLQQRREVGRLAPHRGQPGLGDRTTERRVEVLVAEVDRRRPQPPDEQAHEDADGDKARQDGPGREACAREGLRDRRQGSTDGPDRDCHPESYRPGRATP